MRQIRVLVLLSVVVLLAGSTGPVAGDPSEKLAGDLPRVLAEAGPDDLIPVSVVLRDQLRGSRLTDRAEGIAPGDPARRRVLIDALKEHADRTQAALRAFLADRRLEGRAAAIQPLWIGNVVAAELTPDLVRRVAARDEVARVNWAPKVDVFLERAPAWFGESPVETGSGTDGGTIAAVECGTDLMGAPQVWNELGTTGSGAVVAVIDSGVCWSHPDIANQIWVNPGEDLDADGVVMDPDDMNGVDDDGNGYVDDLIGYDMDQRDNDPNDDNSHGSHCAGTVAGDGTSGTQAGVAPDASIMVLRVGLSFSDEPDVWEAMQYAAENGADAISMSLGWPHGQNPDRATWRANCENTIDLGTAMVIAAGNEGQGSEPDNIRTPGDVPRIISVAATDCSDNIASFSSRGPVTWQDVDPYFDHPYPPGLTKPDVAGPGVSTVSHNLCSGYSTKSGTSMATPHVAGAVALMKSRNPGLLHDDIKQILEDTAIDLGAPGKDNVFGSGRVDAYEAVLSSATSDGRMAIREAEVRCDGGTFNLTVSDQDLEGTGTVAVEIASSTETAPEVVTLVETSATSGVFRGTIGTATGPPASDGVLQVDDGDLVTATYLDADDGQGGTGVPKTDTATTDCGSPVISSVRATGVTDVSAVIRWDTDEPADSRVTYGPERPPGTPSSAPGTGTSHAVTLTGLEACTVYWYEVASADVYGNDARADNAGSYYYFETWGDFGSGLQPCHAGQVSVDAAILPCDASLGVELVDIDLNLDTGAVDTAQVLVTSSTETVPEVLTLTETAPNSSTFTGAIATSGAAVANGDGVVQTADGNVLTVTYLDGDNGTGSAATAYATAASDCAGAGVVSVRVVDLSDETAAIRVETNEATTVSVNWGTTPALGSTAVGGPLATVQVVPVGPFDECGPFYFDVSTTDARGNATHVDAGGAPFEARGYEIPGAVFKDGFETDTGWTLESEWEVGAPQGLGTAPGDPGAAYAGSGVLGHDLTGLGDHPGDYEGGGNVTTRATSPAIDVSALASTELTFRQWLNVGGGGISRVEVRDAGGQWNSLWNSDSLFGEEASSWTQRTFDVSAHAAGNGQFQVRFAQTSGFQASASRAGWNVDRFIVRDGSLPDYGACGGCAGAPSFAGATSAVDGDACGAGGVTVAWQDAAAWGSGGGGTYAVWRDVAPGFDPSPANLVASGVANLSFHDAGAADGVQWWYLVRAESDETCGAGPNNGGALDNNGMYVPVATTSTRPVPAAVTTLRVDLVNHVHVRLSWDPVPDAAAYRVYRADGPQGPFQVMSETGATTWDHLDQAGDARDGYYVVKPINACGQEP